MGKEYIWGGRARKSNEYASHQPSETQRTSKTYKTSKTHTTSNIHIDKYSAARFYHLVLRITVNTIMYAAHIRDKAIYLFNVCYCANFLSVSWRLFFTFGISLSSSAAFFSFVYFKIVTLFNTVGQHASLEIPVAVPPFCTKM